MTAIIKEMMSLIMAFNAAIFVTAETNINFGLALFATLLSIHFMLEDLK